MPFAFLAETAATDIDVGIPDELERDLAVALAFVSDRNLDDDARIVAQRGQVDVGGHPQSRSQIAPASGKLPPLTAECTAAR